MNTSICKNVIEFNKTLTYRGKLPEGFRVLNPYFDNPETIKVMTSFYEKYYNDLNPRKFIIGINPSRHGAGVTGIPFTDTKRLETVCDIKMESAKTHEVSSVFLYDMIHEFGGPEKFYSEFFINSPFPLAIVRQTKDGKQIYANYYDDPELYKMTEEFMIDCLKRFAEFGLDNSEAFVLGKKNATFIKKLNKKANLFKKLTILEHPRYIQQYKSKEKAIYIDKYIISLSGHKL